MPHQPELQTRDQLIFDPLVYSYRMTNAAIEARRLGIRTPTARRRLNRLTDGRFLSRLTAWASAIPEITEPLCVWNPGDREPDFGALAYAAKRRWDKRPIRRQTIYTASEKLLRMYGMPSRSPLKLHQATHDLALNDVCHYCRTNWPEYQFIGEEVFAPTRGHGEGVEDAQLVDGDEIIAVIEHAGSYRKDRIIHFHDHVAERGLSYMLF